LPQLECPRKALGSYYTPPQVAAALVTWSVRSADDWLLDPACGDGRFLALHRRSVGIERDLAAVPEAHARAPHSRIVVADFFEWVTTTRQRFDCAAGNPPFIRYQRFAGEVRQRALEVCARLGLRLSGLSSSWAPFLAAVTLVLKPGGRMAFVVPAEIGHAPYAAPLLQFLASRFDELRVIAIRDKLFQELSEDAWLLFADGFGGATSSITLEIKDRFDDGRAVRRCISIEDWQAWNYRLRPFLLSDDARNVYQEFGRQSTVVRLRELAQAGIGYVTGANDFFHLRRSDASRLGIAARFLVPTVRNGKYLPPDAVRKETVDRWLNDDEPVMLLRLDHQQELPPAVTSYLNSESGIEAQRTYKCRMRNPWYRVPDVRFPDAFLSYMCGAEPALVANLAGCTCTNSVHAVTLKRKSSLASLLQAWKSPLTRLSCELEGHPLGGGMLKLEPGEAGRVLIPSLNVSLSREANDSLQAAVSTMRQWRHYV
jgi:predicted RNA methylase